MVKRSTGLLRQLDFDQWSALAQEDRPTFERLRQMAIEQLIADAPEARQERLRCLQWRIDQERKRSRSPMGACVRISRMMWDQVVGNGGLVEHLRSLGGSAAPENIHCAEVISMSSKVEWRP